MDDFTILKPVKDLNKEVFGANSRGFVKICQNYISMFEMAKDLLV